MDLSQRRELTQSVNRSSGSFELVLGGVLFALVGTAVDAWAGLFPWFTLAFAALGFLGAAISMYYRYQEAMRVEAARRAELATAPPASRNGVTA